LEWFINYLETKFSIKKDKLFIYKNLDDESKIIVTFKLVVSKEKRLNFKELFPSAIPVHKKGDTLYTINALNKLIEVSNDGSLGNIDYKSVKIDWNQYQNKLILAKGNELMFLRISRIF
jgi:hypothetical protein